ncbi:MAG: hypothetical protein IPP42_01275 [Saprospiraceae bacterium]|nr:hypothetical protein [Saprospiraceae bacterium]
MSLYVCDILYKKLAKVKSAICNHDDFDEVVVTGFGGPSKYFPSRTPSSSIYKYANFLNTSSGSLKQIDQFISGTLDKAGYKGHKQYYYVESGYAMTTSLEAINKDGSPLTGSARWDVSISGRNKLSIYETFRSIF